MNHPDGTPSLLSEDDEEFIRKHMEKHVITNPYLTKKAKKQFREAGFEVREREEKRC